MRATLLLCAAVSAAAVPSVSFDVVVYGSTPAGVAAAVAASNAGQLSVALIEPLGAIGGMGAAGGLGLNDQQMSNLTAVTGLARVWCNLNGESYASNSSYCVTHPDMFVAEQSFWRMLNNASVTVWVGCPLDAALRSETTVSSIWVTCNGTTQTQVNASRFIDASYDGEIVVAVGLSFTYGREAASVYNESLAGVFPLSEPLETFGNMNISATFSNGSIIPYVSSDALAPAGSGDDKLMAFQHRACITNNASPGMRVPFPAPPGYNPDDFVLLQRQIDAVMASGKYPQGPPLSYFTDLGPYSSAVFSAGRPKYIICCGTAPVDSDQPDLNRGWATASRQQRQAMIDAHTYYLQGSFFYLGNDPRVPPYTRNNTQQYGLCGDEWKAWGNWPPQIYVRESVRLVGDYVMTQGTIASPRSKPDVSVAMGVWELDKHTVARLAVPQPGNPGNLIAFNEGFFRHGVDPDLAPGTWCGTSGCAPYQLWYDVPFNVTLPKRAEATNVIVPVALSVSSVAFSSTRIETMYMDLGTAAGVASRLSIAAESAVQDVPIASIQSILVQQYGQRAMGPWW